MHLCRNRTGKVQFTGLNLQLETEPCFLCLGSTGFSVAALVNGENKVKQMDKKHYFIQQLQETRLSPEAFSDHQRPPSSFSVLWKPLRPVGSGNGTGAALHVSLKPSQTECENNEMLHGSRGS